jgi:hypothetical protein
VELRGGLAGGAVGCPASGRRPACRSAALVHSRLITGWSGTAQESVIVDVGSSRCVLGHLDHQQRARRIGRVGLVVGRLPGVGDAGLDEDDQAGDDLAVQRQRVDAAQVALGQAVTASRAKAAR